MNGVLLRAFCAVILVVAASGCATLFGGPSDEELIAALMAQWETAFEAADLEGMMACYSEDFSSREASSKADLRQFISGMIDQGFLDGAQAALEGVVPSIEGTIASIGPIPIALNGYEVDVIMELRKEADGTWRIVASEADEGY